MTTTICGHNRETLKFVLRAHDMVVPTVREGILGNAETAAMDREIAIPIRLIKVLGETLRGFGLSVNGDECDEKETTVDIDVGGMGDIITVKTTDPDGHQSWFDYTMPQARAMLLRLLALPDGATSTDAMKALEVGT